MLGHIGINVSNLQQAKAYYDQIMPLLGFELYRHDTDQFAFRRIGGKPGTYIFFYPALEASQFSRHQTGLQHLAFIVPTREAVHAVHTRVQALAAEILYTPQELPQYHPGYFAMFWLDPDGLMLEAVCHRATPEA